MTKNIAASALAKMRWKGKTKDEKTKHGKMMAAAKKARKALSTDGVA